MSIRQHPARETASAGIASISVVGPGRLGRPLAHALRVAGFVVHGPTGRGEDVSAADVVLLCVPDAEIARTAASLAGRAGLIGHTSGATPAAVADFGLHPLQTFRGDDQPDVFHGIACAVGGRTPEAEGAAIMLAERLGARAFPIADADRPAYHAAASIASNFLLTLEHAAERIAGSAGFTSAQARAMLAPLVRRTVDGWVERGAAAALTGPVARGDEETIARQRAAVAQADPALVPLFDELCAQTRVLTAQADELPSDAGARPPAADPGPSPETPAGHTHEGAAA